MKVIVIGSGIAGLAAAIALRRVGIDVTLYERANELREVGAGISLWTNALRALDYIGAGDAVRAASLPLVKSELRCRQGRRLIVAHGADELARAAGGHPVVCMTHRADLVNALSSCLPAVAARYGFECVGVDEVDSRARVRFDNGRADEADAIIGADGIHSIVRTAVLGNASVRYAGYTCWRGICPRPASIEPGYVGEWWGRGQRFGITTLPNDRVYWFATLNAAAGGRASDERTAVAEAFRNWAEPVGELVASTPAGAVLRNDIVDRPPARPWSRGRVCLIGDAAHATTPNLGQGGCMAIEDAVALARALVENRDPAAALDRFTAERFARTAAITRESWRLGRVGQWQFRPACFLRDAVLAALIPRLGPRAVTKAAAFDIGRCLPFTR